MRLRDRSQPESRKVNGNHPRHTQQKLLALLGALKNMCTCVMILTSLIPPFFQFMLSSSLSEGCERARRVAAPLIVACDARGIVRPKSR